MDHDAYIDQHYTSVLGMSGPLSARIAGALLGYQSQNGIAGAIAEIGVFEGRFIIGLALAARQGEKIFAIDTWEWPDTNIKNRFMHNCSRLIPGKNVTCVKAPEDVVEWRDNNRGSIRFIHIDADHTIESLYRDLITSLHVLSIGGVICVDDMLHPGYPLLGKAVEVFLHKFQHLAVFCVSDREDIVSATKFFIADKRVCADYIAFLRGRFPECIWPMNSDFGSYRALVLSTDPRLAKIKDC